MRYWKIYVRCLKIYVRSWMPLKCIVVTIISMIVIVLLGHVRAWILFGRVIWRVLKLRSIREWFGWLWVTVILIVKLVKNKTKLQSLQVQVWLLKEEVLSNFRRWFHKSSSCLLIYSKHKVNCMQLKGSCNLPSNSWRSKASRVKPPRVLKPRPQLLPLFFQAK